jgi:hypothetical protein
VETAARERRDKRFIVVMEGLTGIVLAGSFSSKNNSRKQGIFLRSAPLRRLP